MNGFQFKLRKFQKGSYPIVEGDSDTQKFFIIREGKVRLHSTTFSLTGGGEDILTPGDFFGVISTMAKRPRVDSAEALEDCVLIEVDKSNFSELIRNNSSVALKITRYFSKQLRHLNSVLTRFSFRKNTCENPKYLYSLGEYHLNNRMNFAYGAYALLRYVQCNPDGEYVSLAKQKLAKINQKYGSKIKLKPEKDGFHLIYEENQVIFLEHEPGHQLYILQEGEVRITKVVENQEVLLNVLKPGDIFGEMAILENLPRTASAFAASKVKVMGVSKNNFDQLVLNHPELATKIIEVLSNRIWFIYRHIANALITDPETRLYDALYIHLLKDRVAPRSKASHLFNLTYEDLLNFTGLHDMKGVDALNSMKKNNKHLTGDKGKILCTDLATIESKMNLIQRNLQIRTAGLDNFGESSGSVDLDLSEHPG